ncbi:hypothetical protein HYT18_03585 [Candidatus Microgenomates bacterium]|nr:hypothetical protein [Candidatus Microgenomates bacterium]
MKYLAQSEIWQLDQVTGVQALNGQPPSRVLARFKQIFPLTLFRDELIIEELRMVWVRRDGPWAEEVISIMATDIACVDASSGPFFGHVHIKSLTGGLDIFVDKLQRGHVYQIRALVETIALASRAGKIINGSLQAGGHSHFPSQGHIEMN